MSTSAKHDQPPATTNDEDNNTNNNHNNTDDGDISMDEDDQPHHHRPISAISPISSRSPLSSTSTDSRRLFQRLWTDDDEIAILRGFLDFNRSRGGNLMGSHQYDTGAFYSQIRTQIRLDFTKSQLVEKLRRLKKKYRNNVAKMAPRGTKDFFFAFKTAHDRKAFEVSDKIWGDATVVPNSTENGDEEDYTEAIHGGALEVFAPVPMMTSAVLAVPAPPAKNPNCKKEVSNRGVVGDDVVISNCGFEIGLPTKNLELLGEKWKKQQILELEVFSQRLELLQEDIKSALLKLRNR